MRKKKETRKEKRFSLRMDEHVFRRLDEIKHLEEKYKSIHVSLNDLIIIACKLYICTYSAHDLKTKETRDEKI